MLAVATSKPEPFAVRILEHVGLLAHFASVHGATLDGAVRHKEQVVAAALARHPGGVDPVLVGDRAQDVLGAAAHGLPCIGAGWGPAEDGELERPARRRSRPHRPRSRATGREIRLTAVAGKGMIVE